MKDFEIISYNVNGLRSVYKKGFRDWLINTDPDIICLQEIKSKESDLPDDLINLNGYFSFWHSAVKQGYSGTALYSKIKPLKVEIGIGDREFDNEGRIMIAHFRDFSLINCYVPNGRPDHSRVNLKLKFYNTLLKKCSKILSTGQNVIICGDWNVAHTENDIFNPKSNLKKTGFLKEERKYIDDFIKKGFFDVLRHFYPDDRGKYTWWLQAGDFKIRNAGRRFDYFFASQKIIEISLDSRIYSEIQFSDHCPISIILKAFEPLEEIKITA